MIIIELFVVHYLESLSNRINSVLSKLDIEINGPTFRKTENNMNMSYNIYSRNDSIDKIWELLQKELKENFQELSKSGEVISYTSQDGSIKDQGVEYFKVLKANLFECYIYEPESFIYARLLEEYDIIKKNVWISIDVDGIEKSAWFKD